MISRESVLQCLIVPAIFLLLGACAPAIKIKPEPIEIKMPEVVQKPVVVVKSEVVEKKLELRVAVLLSRSVKAFKNISKIISNKLNIKAKEYILTGNKFKDARLIKNIQSGSYSHVVALGIKAAKAATMIKSGHVVFSHVFNYKDHQLTSSKIKGVSTLPSPEQLFKDWKSLSPKLESVALVTGSNLEYYISRVKKAAAKYGIKIVHRVVKNDKEFVYVSKRLPLAVRGHWILPDNKILSRTALKRVLSFNAKNGKQSAVFSKGLSSFGGLFYVSVPDAEVANLIMARVTDSLGKKTIPGQDVLIAKSHVIGINKKMAKQLGLTIPDNYTKYISD